MSTISMVDFRFVQKTVARFCGMTNPSFAYKGLTYQVFGANSPYTSHQSISFYPYGPESQGNLYIFGHELPWDSAFSEGVSFHVGGYNGAEPPTPEKLPIEDHGFYWEKPRVVRIPAKFADDCTRRINDNRWCVESLGNPIGLGYQTVWATIHRLKRVGWQWGTEWNNQNRVPITVGEFYEWEFPSPEATVAIYRHHDGTFDPDLILSYHHQIEGYDWIGEYNSPHRPEKSETRDFIWRWEIQPTATEEEDYKYYHNLGGLDPEYIYIHRRKPEPRPQLQEEPITDPVVVE